MRHVLATVIILSILMFNPIVTTSERTSAEKIIMINTVMDLYEEGQSERFMTINMSIVIYTNLTENSFNVFVVINDVEEGTVLKIKDIDSGVVYIDKINLERKDNGVPVIDVDKFEIYDIIHREPITPQYPFFNIVYPASDLDKALENLTIGKIFASYYTYCNLQDNYYPLEVVKVNESIKIIESGTRDRSSGTTTVTVTKTITKATTVTKTTTMFETATVTETVTYPITKTATETITVEEGHQATETITETVTETRHIIKTVTETLALSEGSEGTNIYNLLSVIALVIALMAFVLALRYR